MNIFVNHDLIVLFDFASYSCHAYLEKAILNNNFDVPNNEVNYNLQSVNAD
jgi:hypothetical protein